MEGEGRGLSWSLSRFGHISHLDELVVVFFLGGAVDAIAYDWSDYIYFYVSSLGPLTWFQASWYYAWVPFFYEVAFAILALLFAYFKPMSAWVVLYLYVFMTLSATVASFMLPSGELTWFFVFTVVSGTVVGVMITLGMARRVGHLRRLW